jgi:hypothetical protein
LILSLVGVSALALWQNQQTLSRAANQSQALELLAEARALLVAPTEEKSALQVPPELQEELLSILEKQMSALENPANPADSLAKARGAIADLENKLRENLLSQSPTDFATAIAGSQNAGSEEFLRDGNGLPANEAQRNSQVTDLQTLADRLAAIRNGQENSTTESAAIDRGEAGSPILSSMEGQLGDETPQAGKAVGVPESLPAGISGSESSGPPVEPVGESTPQPDAVDLVAEGPVMELPATTDAQPSLAGRLARQESDGTAAAEEVPGLGTAEIDDANVEDVPVGARETVQRYFEILRQPREM